MPPILRRVLTVLTLLTLAACAQQPPLNCDLVQIARLPIEVRGRLLTVPVSVNGQTLRLIVDSGAERTTLSEAAAGRLHLPRDLRRVSTFTGVGGSVTNADAVISSLVLGNVRLPVDRIAVGRFGFDHDSAPLADGLLGADILLAFDLDIDVPGKALTLYRVRRCINNQPPWKEPFVAVTGITARKDRMLIPFHLDGVAGNAILDTGASATTIGLRMATRLGLNDQTMALDRKVMQRGAGTGTVAARYHWFRELRVGPAVIPGLMLAVLPIDAGVGDALIGEDFLEGRRVWLSFPTRQMFVSTLAHDIAPR